MSKARRAATLATTLVLTGVVALRIGVLRGSSTETRRMSTPRFVGSATCVSCHTSEAGAWQTSQHRAAMAEANDATVLGDFKNAALTHAGTRTVFFRTGSKFVVRTDGRDGTPSDYEIRYTFGVYPLQQYLVSMGDGRLQALPIAWDARPKSAGGQRWFHLYPTERLAHDDELHWTRPSQNWNFMCADCHSTELKKNYDASTDRFDTRWSEISVGCEACHGPGSSHLDWAKSADRRAANRDSTKGLTVALNERRGVVWSNTRNTGNAPHPSRARTTDREIQVCAQCHSRRSQLAEGYAAGKQLLDYYLPTLLTRPLYHADGQQRGEVYDWGSFLQSKMYTRGVTCGDCHDPHSGKLRATQTVNATCTTCHVATRYDTPAHHHHTAGGAGASCASCHMPTTTYMLVDQRHDHSLRIPRPDLTVTLGTPNACANCHSDRGPAWAATAIRSWTTPHDLTAGFQRFASVFTAADSGTGDAQDKLRALAGDATQPTIARATALAAFVPRTPADLATLGAGLNDANPLVRLGALQATASLAADARATLVSPLLSDSLRVLRIEAAGQLALVPEQALPLRRRAAYERAGDEFVAAQRYNADQPDARVNLGSFYAARRDFAAAEPEFRAALRIDPKYAPAYINLADMYRVQQRDADAERVLRDGIAVCRTTAALHYALGLTLARLKRMDNAVVELRLAATTEPANLRFAYGYAVALESTGKKSQAIQLLERTLIAHPGDADITSALATMRSQTGGTR